MIDKQQIKHIHTLLSNYNIDDKKYRELLEDLFDVNSCKELTHNQASKLIFKIQMLYDDRYRQGYMDCMSKSFDINNIEDFLGRDLTHFEKELIKHVKNETLMYILMDLVEV